MLAKTEEMLLSTPRLIDLRNQPKKLPSNRIPMRAIYLHPPPPPERKQYSRKLVNFTDVKDSLKLLQGDSSVSLITQRLLSQGLEIIPPLLLHRRKSKFAALLKFQKPILNAWHDERILKLVFKNMQPRELLNCSLVCKQWRSILITGFMEKFRLQIDFKRLKQPQRAYIEDQLRLAYIWRITAVTLTHMRDDCLPLFIGAYYTTFKEFFPGCPISLPSIEGESFNSVPDLFTWSPTPHSSCAGSLDCNNLRRMGSAPIGLPMKASRHITQLTVDNCCLGDLALEQILNLMHTVTNLSLISCNCLSNVALWSCLRPWTTHINVRDCLNFKDDALRAIVQCAPGLQELSIQVCYYLSHFYLHIISEFFNFIVRGRVNIIALLIQIYRITDAALGTFMSRRNFNLRVFRLAYGSDITFLGVANLVGSLPGLQELRLTGCSRINDAAVALICEYMRYLEILEISSNSAISDTALTSIGRGLQQLVQLSLDR